MTSRHKELTKSLKGPDQFQVQVMSAMDWAVKNARLIVYVVIPVVAVVAVALAVQFFQGKRKESRLEELGKVQVVYEAESRKANEARQAIYKKMEELDAKAKPKDAAKDPKTGAPVADPVIAAQKTALQKQADAITPDHSDSIGKFDEFFKKHQATPEGWAAGMQAAHIYLEQDKLAEARPLLEEVVAKSQGSSFYQTQARLALVGLYEDTGDYDKGLAQIDALEKIVDPDLKPRILLDRGQLQMLKNTKAEAKATFTSIIENHATSPEAQKARSLIALLNG